MQRMKCSVYASVNGSETRHFQSGVQDVRNLEEQ